MHSETLQHKADYGLSDEQAMWAFREGAIKSQKERYGDVALIRQAKFEARRPQTLAETPAA